MVELSVVSTLFLSSPHLASFCARTRAAALRLGASFEIVLVDDGSPDDSLSAALRLLPGMPELRVVELSRHFGHYPAVLAGLAQARGDLVFLVDCDLEEPPELLEAFWAVLRADESLDVVYGVQSRRRGGASGRWSGAAFYRLARWSSGEPLTSNAVMARLMRRDYVDALLRHREAPLSLDVLATTVGFRQRAVPVEKGSRGASSYTWRGRLEVGLRTILLYGAWPAWTTLLTGILVALSSAGGGVLLLLSGGLEALRRDSLLLSLWFVAGSLAAAAGLGLLLLYQVLAEVRRRPTSVRRVHESGTRVTR
jgi:putative glycosyltransferase